MRFKFARFAPPLFVMLVLLPSAFRAAAQSRAACPQVAEAAVIPDAPQPQTGAPTSQSQSQSQKQNQAGNQDQAGNQNQAGQNAPANSQPGRTPAGTSTASKHKPPPQPKRILGLMPNYRAVSAGVMPPPPTPRKAFVIATDNSFDYSSFVFVGITSLLAEGTNAHPQLGKGVPGYWAYSWRGFADKVDGNYWVIWALPTVVHEDERYYAKGEGTILGRGVYAASRILITPDYHGKNTFNAAEIFGRGISQAISLSYYPSSDKALGPFMEKYGYALGRDALTNTFREFWPDIDAHLIHRHRHQPQASE